MVTKSHSVVHSVAAFESDVDVDVNGLVLDSSAE